MLRTCEACGTEFEQRAGPGKPRHWCYDCLPPVRTLGQAAYLRRWKELRGWDQSAYMKAWRTKNPAATEAYNARRRATNPYDFGIRKCCICGSKFKATMPNQANCSRQCYKSCVRKCAYCDKRIIKPKSSTRYENAYCDDTCKGLHYSVLRTPDRLPIGPVERTAINIIASRCEEQQQPQRIFISGPCAECARQFTASTTGRVAKYCSFKCSRRARKRKDKGSELSQRLRLQVFIRDDYICQLCGEPTNIDAHYNADDAPTVDHIFPKSIERIDEPWNLQTAHRRCNTQKRDAITANQLALAI